MCYPGPTGLTLCVIQVLPVYRDALSRSYRFNVMRVCCFSMYCVVATVDKYRFRIPLLDIPVNTDPVVLVHLLKLYNDGAQSHAAD